MKTELEEHSERLNLKCKTFCCCSLTCLRFAITNVKNISLIFLKLFSCFIFYFLLPLRRLEQAKVINLVSLKTKCEQFFDLIGWNTVSPPELTRDAPVSHTLHPVVPRLSGTDRRYLYKLNRTQIAKQSTVFSCNQVKNEHFTQLNIFRHKVYLQCIHGHYSFSESYC